MEKASRFELEAASVVIATVQILGLKKYKKKISVKRGMFVLKQGNCLNVYTKCSSFRDHVNFDRNLFILIKNLF